MTSELPPRDMRQKTEGGKLYCWWSICSMHQVYRKGCNLCMTGCWNEWEQYLASKKLHDENYDEWFKRVNKEDSPERNFLEEVFPGLKLKAHESEQVIDDEQKNDS